MSSFQFYSLGSNSTPGFWRFYVAVGVLLILFALLIIAMPELLAFLFAGFVLFLGIGLVSVGLGIRRISRYSASEHGKTVVVNRFD